MKQNRFWKRKSIAVALSVLLVATGSVQAFATNSAQSKKAEAESSLSEVSSQISDLQNQQSALQEEIDALDSELVTTIASISLLEDEIVSKEEQLALANANLLVAQETEAEQYESMKERISYMYVNGGDLSFFNALMGATSFADVLNRVQMFATVYSYDRQMLTEYQETVALIEALIEEICEEEADLLNQQSDLETQQTSLNTMIDEKSAEMDDFDSLLASAQSLAEQYKETIQEQNALIAQEAAAAAALAAAQAAESAAAEASASQSNTTQSASTSTSSSSSTSTTTSSSTSSTTSTASGDTSSTTSTASSDTSSTTSTASSDTSSSSGSTSSSSSSSGSTSSSSSSTSSSSSSSSSATGQAVANYACQFVGNPYVWGGTSLTDGADCSGFVMSVYAHFGVSLPHSSYALRSVGYAVSVSEMQPGDIICYEGHVAIYIGNGAIVHAASEASGIKISYNYAYKTVLAVRRIF